MDKWIYLAARYSRHPEMRDIAAELRSFGYGITSRWILGGHDTVDADGDTDKTRFAEEDVSDLFAADTVISFTEAPGEQAGRGRGGRHVEFGLALASNLLRSVVVHGKRQRLIVVGHRENVFHWLRSVEFYATWAECLAVLSAEARAAAAARRAAVKYGEVQP